MTPPRVLFLSSESPHSSGAGAIVFLRLFADYPPDRLLVLTSHPPPGGAERLACRYERLPLRVDRLNRTRFWTWRNGLRAFGGASWLSLRPIDRALGDFQPDLVVTLMQDSWFYDYAARYARLRRLPLALFVHDLPDGFEPVPAWLKAAQRARDRTVYRQARRRLCISAPMERHFAETCGVAGDVLPPPRSATPVRQAPEKCAQLKQPGRLTLGYGGGLHYGYGEQLLRLLPALRTAGVTLELFGAPPGGGPLAALNEATDVLRFHGYASKPEHAWRSLLERCDVVLQPYLNPAAQHARQYRTHFPSKLGDCLSLGLPVLVTGPADAAGAAWCLARPGSALVVTDPAPAAFATALARLQDDGPGRVALARQAQAAAEEFAVVPLRCRLQELLASALPS